MEKEDGRMAEAAGDVLSVGKVLRLTLWLLERSFHGKMLEVIYALTAGVRLRPGSRSNSRAGVLSAGLALLIFAIPGNLRAETDCLACHADKTMQNAAGHSIAVDGQKLGASIHGSLKCGDCHADIKEYP